MTTPRRRADRRQHAPKERWASTEGACDYFDFDVAIEPPLLRLRLYGELDLASAPALELVHCILLDDIEVVRIDLSRMRFCDTAGLRSLARLCAGADQHHHVEVVGAQPSLRRLVAITGLARRWLTV